MQKRRQSSLTTVIFLLIVFSLFSFVYAQTGPSEDSSQQVAITGSPNLVTLSIKLSNNKTITVTQGDGEMITTGPANKTIGITPHIRNNDSVSLDFFHITDVTAGNQVIGKNLISIGSLELNDNLPQTAFIDRIYSIQLISISKSGKDVGINKLSFCCVTCDNEQTCSRCVELSCGLCGCQ